MKFLQKGNIVLIYITNILTFKENLLYLLLNIFPSFSDPQLYQTYSSTDLHFFSLILVFDSFFYFFWFFFVLFFRAKTPYYFIKMRTLSRWHFTAVCVFFLFSMWVNYFFPFHPVPRSLYSTKYVCPYLLQSTTNEFYSKISNQKEVSE